LLVEDDDSVRNLARHVLSACGYSVLEATNGREAVQLAQEHVGRIDLLLSDVVMPHLGGRELAERLVRLIPGLRVLFCSGYTDDAIVRHGVLEAEFAFLQKPFTPLALAQKVREVLNQPSSQKPVHGTPPANPE
jgi:CheY-like chemotaxis protein